MILIDTQTGESHQVEIKLLEIDDFKVLSKKRYFFDWKLEKEYEIYKLSIKDTDEILGLISMERIPTEWRIHVRLLTVSKENKGKNKNYENIAGNLLTYVSKIALKEYGELACVSLKPKGKIAQHYIDKFDMNVTGATLSVELPEILNLINKYDNE